MDLIIECDLLVIIFEMLVDKLFIWVMYYLVGVEKMDCVLFLEEGKMLMEGFYVELMVEELCYKWFY